MINIIGNNYSIRRKKNIILIIIITVIWVIISLGLIFNMTILSKIEQNTKVEKNITTNEKSTEIINPKNNPENINTKQTVITEKNISQIKTQIKHQKEKTIKDCN